MLQQWLGIVVIVLLPLHERLYVDRRDDPRLMAQLTQGPADKVRAEACLHSDHTRWQLLEGLGQRQSLDLAPKSNLAVSAEADDVEDFFANVDADRCQA